MGILKTSFNDLQGYDGGFLQIIFKDPHVFISIKKLWSHSSVFFKIFYKDLQGYNLKSP